MHINRDDDFCQYGGYDEQRLSSSVQRISYRINDSGNVDAVTIGMPAGFDGANLLQSLHRQGIATFIESAQGISNTFGRQSGAQNVDSISLCVNPEQMQKFAFAGEILKEFKKTRTVEIKDYGSEPFIDLGNESIDLGQDYNGHKGKIRVCFPDDLTWTSAQQQVQVSNNPAEALAQLFVGDVPYNGSSEVKEKVQKHFQEKFDQFKKDNPILTNGNSPLPRALDVLTQQRAIDNSKGLEIKQDYLAFHDSVDIVCKPSEIDFNEYGVTDVQPEDRIRTDVELPLAGISLRDEAYPATDGETGAHYYHHQTRVWIPNEVAPALIAKIEEAELKYGSKPSPHDDTKTFTLEGDIATVTGQLAEAGVIPAGQAAEIASAIATATENAAAAKVASGAPAGP